MALTTLEALSRTNVGDQASSHVFVQDRLLDIQPNTSPSGLTTTQRLLLENLLNLPDLTVEEVRLFQRTLDRDRRLIAQAEQRLADILNQRLANLERQRAAEQGTAGSRNKNSNVPQSWSGNVKRRNGDAPQSWSANEQEEEQRRAAELGRQRQEEEQKRAAELERQRQEEEEQRAAELERQRQDEERQRLAELERQRQEELEKQREAERQEELAAVTPEPESLTGSQRTLLGNLIGLSIMSSVERGMMQKVLDDNRRLSDAEEARLQQRYAALSVFEEETPPPPSDDEVPGEVEERQEQNDVAVLEPPEPESQPAPEDDPAAEDDGEIDVIDLLPRFKVEMPSPILEHFSFT